MKAGEAQGLSIAHRQAMVAARSEAVALARSERAAMLRQVRADLIGADADKSFQAGVARRYWRDLVGYERPIYRPDGSLATRADVELRNVLIEVSNSDGASKLNQILNYQRYGGGKPVALVTRKFLPVGRQVDYVTNTGATLIHGTDWQGPEAFWRGLDDFVYHGARY